MSQESRMSLAAMTQETLDLMKASLAKNVTLSTGLSAYDLQAPAKNIFPVITPLRNALARGTPAAAVLSAAGTGATLPAATYSVIVVALAFEGYRNSSITTGVATTKLITGNDVNTYTLAGGSSMRSANATQAVTLGQTL